MGNGIAAGPAANRGAAGRGAQVVAIREVTMKIVIPDKQEIGDWILDAKDWADARPCLIWSFIAFIIGFAIGVLI